MKSLKLAETLSLPVDVTTQALAWLGRRGSGKTYGATKLAELLYAAKAQFVALDPVGVWYGLRLAADGKGKGLDVPIFGGLHGDIPIEPTGGSLLADVIVDRGISAVVDLSQIESDAAKARFARDFGARFFFRKKAKPSPVHLFLEEAQEIVPQNPQADENMMLHTYQRIAKLGRNFGIGISFISQRPQEVHKKVINLAECVFAFQLTGPHERKAVAEWIKEHVPDQVGEGGKKEKPVDLVAELPKLKTGFARVWSPAWLEVSEEVQIAEKWTYAAGSTPVVGAKQVDVKALEAVELAQINDAMKATIERAKADDPKELRKKIRELEQQLAAKPGAPAPSQPKVVEVPVLTSEDWSQLRNIVERAASIRGDFLLNLEHFERLAGEFQERADRLRVAGEKSPHRSLPAAKRQPAHVPPPPPATNGRAEPPPPRSAAPSVKQRVLDALAELETLRAHTPTRELVCFLSGYSNTQSAGFKNAVSELKEEELIEYPSGGTIAMTPAGRAQANFPARPQSPGEVRNRIVGLLGGASGKLLDVLMSEYPNSLPRDAAAQATGYTNIQSAGFKEAVSRLSTLGFIHYPQPGTIAATDTLFLE